MVNGRASGAAEDDPSIIISLKKDEIVQIGWLTGGDDFVSKSDEFILYAFVNFSSEEIREQG